MGYPVAYRQGSKGNIAKSRWTDPKAFTERYIPPKEGLARDTFRRAPAKSFGRRTAAELAMELLERQIKRKAGTLAIRLIPVAGEILLAGDAIDLLIDTYTTITTYPDAHWEPGVGTPIYSRPGWTLDPAEYHYGSYLIEKTGRWIGGSWAGFYYSEPPHREGERGLSDTWVLENMSQLHKWWQPWYEGSKDGDVLWSDGDKMLPGPQAQPTPVIEYEPGEPVFVQGDPVYVTVPTTIPIGDELPLSPMRIKEVGHGTTVQVETADLTVVPAIVTTVTPQGTTNAIGEHPLAPRPGKERKVLTRMAAAGVINIATESLDVLNAIHDALPIQYRHGARKMHKRGGGFYWRIDRAWSQQKHRMVTESPNHVEALQVLWKHWDKVDLKQAVTNLATNQVEDTLIGASAQRTTKNLRKWYDKSGRAVGIFAGSAL